MASMKPIQTAIVGYGMSAKIFHIPFIEHLPGLFKLTAIMQRDPSSKSNAMVSNAPAERPDLLHYTSVEGLLQNREIDLVVITTPPSSHFDIATQCLKGGKHVLIEKPLTPTLDEALRLERLAQETSKVCAVYQNRRFDSDFLTLKALLNLADPSKGPLGRVVDFETHMDRHRPSPPASSWKTDHGERGRASGAVYDLGTHLLDQVLVLYGSPTWITGFIFDQRVYPDGQGSAGGDSFVAILQYAGDASSPTNPVRTVTVKATVVSPMAPERQLRYLVKGTQGTWEKLGVDIQEDQLKKGIKPMDGEYGVEPAEQAGGTLTQVAENTGQVSVKRLSQHGADAKGYVLFYEQLAQWIKKGSEHRGAVPDVSDGSELIRLVESVQLSSREGRRVAFKA
ncbi:MAG: hypothetical protein M1828_005830 [Chrysothrix sp. TS-e1954]|nr:MAG: hypothetical protein M1828_005830 [Chrysothrix sp. TS-e1954]